LVLPEDDTTIAYDAHLFPQKLGPVSTYHSRKFWGQKLRSWQSVGLNPTKILSPIFLRR
jgi:hypothetical protein